MNKNSSWQTVSQKYVYQSKWLKVRHDEVIRPDGKPGEYDVIEKKDFVLVIPKIGDLFYLVQQYRYPISSSTFEFPQGGIEEDETAEEAAKREFEEETGYKATSVKRLGHLWLAGGHHTQGYSIYLVEEFKPGMKNLDDSEGDMVTIPVTEKDLKAKIKSGEIKDASTVAAFTLYNLNK